MPKPIKFEVLLINSEYDINFKYNIELTLKNPRSDYFMIDGLVSLLLNDLPKIKEIVRRKNA